MTKFIDLKKHIRKQFDAMSTGNLFRADVDGDLLWDLYLKSFPEGTDPFFRKRTEHDCSCCKSFIRRCGSLISIVDGKKVSIWDIDIGGHYQIVANALSKLVKSKNLSDVFLHNEKRLGTDKNRELSESCDLVNLWQHFYVELPSRFVEKGVDIATTLSFARSSKDVFKRGLNEITVDSINAVIELIDQNSLYRGQEHKTSVVSFLKEKIVFDQLKTNDNKDLFAWERSVSIGGRSRVRNSVIGTLLTDLSEGIDLEKAVKSFETKVAPVNYKRPTALITKTMIAKAQKKVQELGIAESLERRFAYSDDITINNVLFMNRGIKKKLGVFDEMTKEAPVKNNTFNKVEEIGVDDFVKNVLPKAESLEVLFLDKQENNLMSLIAPVTKESKEIFKWKNNFSWSYNGEVTDSIKQRVKKAGGNVSGILRCSLSWFNYDDLDIHVMEPDGNHIGFQRKNGHSSTGQLDVDMNANGKTTRQGVENIFWSNKSRMQEGVYSLYINQFAKREDIDFGFNIEIDFEGTVYDFSYSRIVKGNVLVAEFEFSHEKGFRIIKSLPHSRSARNIWGISTNCFQKVKMVMNSPNHWDGDQLGNKHWFFMLEDCKNPGNSRGFYNEFISDELIEHRKVFEVMSSKMKTDISDNQLSGLGFSSTKRDQLICKVSGSFSRVIKVNF